MHQKRKSNVVNLLRTNRFSFRLLFSVIPATLLVLFMGCLSAYSFYMIGRMCSEDGGDSLTDLWKRDVGKGGWVVTLSILVFTLGAALTYSICLGDAFSSLAETVGLQVRTETFINASLYNVCHLHSRWNRGGSRLDRLPFWPSH